MKDDFKDDLYALVCMVKLYIMYMLFTVVYIAIILGLILLAANLAFTILS